MNVSIIKKIIIAIALIIVAWLGIKLFVLEEKVLISSEGCAQYYKTSRNVYINLCAAFSDDISTNKIKEADVKSFELLKGELYTKDKNHVYFRGEVIPNADTESFVVLENKIFGNGKQSYTYAKDRNHVYYMGGVGEGVNPDTFSFVNYDLTKDDKYVYMSKLSYNPFAHNLIKIDGSDSGSIIKLEDSRFAKDHNNVYYRRYIIEEADPRTFSVLNYYFAKDNRHVYYTYTESYNVVEGADANTFVVIEDNRKGEENKYKFSQKGKDMYREYKYGRN